jgi:predicted AlkP superfamily phosphohydrolase/phosphomutase
MKKIFVFGIDGAMPEKVFGEWLDELPNMKKLMQQGCYAKLNSTIPPLTAVAWTSMRTGKPPAEHSIFEYIFRKNNSYTDIGVISSNNIKEKSIWHVASENNKKSIVCSIPITWPIKPFNGIAISGFLTPGIESEYTFPIDFKKEIETLFDEPFILDIHDHRKLSKKELLEKCIQITEMHFKLMKYLIQNKEWDLFFGVIMASDWVNHGFFKYMDNKHRNYEPNSEFKDTLKDYYKLLDRNLGELISLLEKGTTIIIVSDHGMTRMHNRLNLSDWLLKRGYLVLKEESKIKLPLKPEMIDWEKTRAWAIGAYECQIFINLKNREPQGCVDEKDYDKLIDTIQEGLSQIKGDNGEELDTRFFRKKIDFIGKNNQHAPDLMVYLDNLRYGCNNALIHNKTMWNIETLKGKDDAGHSQQGIFIMNKSTKRGDIGEIDILDIAPTILNRLNIKIPEDFKGKVIK